MHHTVDRIAQTTSCVIPVLDHWLEHMHVFMDGCIYAYMDGLYLGIKFEKRI